MNKFILLPLAVLCGSISMAQVKSVSFNDGSQMEYEVLERTTDNARTGAVRIGIGTMGLNYQYVNPQKFEANAGVSLDGFYGSALIGLGGKDKEIDYTLTLKSVASGANSTTHYVVKGERIMKTSFVGLHVGFKKYFELFWPNLGVSVSGGLGHFMTQHVKYFVKEKTSGKSSKMNITRRRGIYGDVLLFPAYSTTTFPYDPVTGTSVETVTKSKQFGAMINWEGTSFASKKGKKGAGLCTAFGIGKVFGGSKEILFNFGIGIAF